MREDLEKLMQIKHNQAKLSTLVDRTEEQDMLRAQSRKLEVRDRQREFQIKKLNERSAQLQAYFEKPHMLTYTKAEEMKTRYIESIAEKHAQAMLERQKRLEMQQEEQRKKLI